MRMKTRFSTVGLLALSLTVIALVLPVFSAEIAPQLDKFQGTWVLVSGERDGKKLSDDHVKNSKITYKGNQGELTSPHQHSEPIFFEIVKIDPEKSPKEFHLVRKSGPSAGKTIVAIYEFDGNDQFRFTFDPTATTAPKDFASKEGSGLISHTWKRTKP